MGFFDKANKAVGPGAFPELFRSVSKTGDPESFVIDPLVGQKTKAADFLLGALETPDFQARQIEGLTATESTAQDTLSSFAGAGVSPERRSAIESISQMLAQPSDITSTPEFKAILDVVNKGTDDRVNTAIRRTKLEGVGASNVQQSQVGREIAAGRTAQVAALAPFAEGERNRRLSASDLLSRLVGDESGQTIQQLGAVQQFGALPRGLSQAEKDAQFQALLQKQLFASTTGADVASRVLGGSIDTAVQPGDPSLLAQLAPIIGAAGKAAIAA